MRIRGEVLLAARRGRWWKALVLAAIPGLLAVLLTVFGEGGTPPAQASSVTVEVGSNWFCDSSYQSADPNVYCTTTINVGDTVTWHRVAGSHNVVECGAGFGKWSDADGACLDPDWYSPILSGSGPDWSHTFNTAGTYFYLCELHWPEQKGKIVAQPAATSTPTTTAAPTTTPTPSPTSSAAPTPSATGTPAPAPSPTPSATPTPSPTPTLGPSPTPSPSPAPTPSPTPVPTPTPAPGGQIVNVDIGEYFFSPEPLTVNVGDTIVWTNHGSLSHTSTSYDGYWDSGKIKPGQSFSYTATGSGTFRYHCVFHEGHEGKLVVEGTAPPPSPPPSPPPTPPPVGPPTTTGATANVTVDMVGSPHAYAFTPDPVTIQVGQSVAWRNATGAIHTATAEETGPDGWPAWDTGDVAPGQTSAPLTFAKEGRFSYYCTYHPEQVGTVVVGAAGAAQPAPSGGGGAVSPAPTPAAPAVAATQGEFDLKLGAPAGTLVDVGGGGVDRNLVVSLTAGGVLGLVAVYGLWRRKFVT